MKGKKGGESPATGVSFSTHTVPQTAKGNILAAAKKRKRGGAVAPLKVDGSMPKARLDKPKRARGGAAASGSRRSGEDYHDLAREYGIASPGKDERMQSQQWRDRVDNVDSQAQRTRKVDADLVKDASAYGRPKMGSPYTEDTRYDKLASSMGGAPKGAPKGSMSAALKGLRKPERQRGGKVGADTSPMTHAAHKKPTRGHSVETNIT